MKRRALLAAIAGTAAIGGGSALARSRDEDPATYRKRTGADQLGYSGTEGLRTEMQSVAQGLRATAVLDNNAPARVKALAGSPVLERLQSGESTRLEDYRAALDAYAEINPGRAAELRGKLARFEPQRDRDVSESGLGALGAGAAGVAALALTRGRTASARRALIKSLKGGGLGALGGAGGAALANDTQATLSGDDMGDVGAWAAGGAALGAGLVGGRSGAQRLARLVSVRRQRLAQAMPEAAGPAFDARAMQRASGRKAQASVPLVERDSDILAADVFHMERTLDAAGMPRVLTNAKSADEVARALRREADWDGVQPALDQLERNYREALKVLGVSQDRAPSLRQIDPYVTDPADRAVIDSSVKQVLTRRQKRRKAQRKRRANEKQEAKG